MRRKLLLPMSMAHIGGGDTRCAQPIADIMPINRVTATCTEALTIGILPQCRDMRSICSVVAPCDAGRRAPELMQRITVHESGTSENGEVVLTRDVTKRGLRAGDVGTVVEHHAVPNAPEEGDSVEFFDMTGNTVAVVTLPTSALRLPTPANRPAVRALSA